MFEDLYQVVTDHFGISAFDVMSFNEVDQFSVFE